MPNTLFGTFTTDSGGYHYRDKDGTHYTFTLLSSPQTATGIGSTNQLVGRLTQIDYRGNERLSIEYHATDLVRVTKVSDTLTNSRRLDFFYGSGNSAATVTKVEGGKTICTWTYEFTADSGGPGYTTRRLIKSKSPTDQFVTTSTETMYEHHETGPTARIGLISKITEPNQTEWHEFEYYANGRAFQVKDSLGHIQSFSYNLFRNHTEFTDEGGNVETYIHQDNGLLTKKIHSDRSRLEFTWGNQNESSTTDDHEESLMLTSTDEVGAKETFTYRQPGSTNYRPGELQQSVSKDLVTTTYAYWVSPNSQYSYISELSSITTANPGAAPLVTNLSSATSAVTRNELRRCRQRNRPRVLRPHDDNTCPSPRQVEIRDTAQGRQQQCRQHGGSRLAAVEGRFLRQRNRVVSPIVFEQCNWAICGRRRDSH